MKTREGRISIKIQKKEQKEKILLLHGFNDTKDTFVFLEPFLASHFQIFSFDYCGHGGSSWKKNGDYHYSEILQDLYCVYQKYIHEPFHIIGHSLGGGLAARFNGLFPEIVKSMICLEGFSGLRGWDTETTRIRSWLENVANRNLTFSKKENSKIMPTFSDAVKRLSSIYNTLPEEKVRILARPLLKKTKKGFTWKNDPKLRTGNTIPFPPEFSRYLWNQIRSPVMLLMGSNSNLKPSHLDEILSHFMSIEFHEVENAGHNLHHDNPNRVLELLKSFYSKILPVQFESGEIPHHTL